jgi:hypothetical protein
MLMSPSEWRQAPPFPFFVKETREDSYPVSISLHVRPGKLMIPKILKILKIMSNVG